MHYAPRRSYGFYYKGKEYGKDTKIIYNGVCNLNGEKVHLNNETLILRYFEGAHVCFEYKNKMYKSYVGDFFPCIVDVTNESPKLTKKEVVWTDGMVTATLWYVVVMIGAIFMYDRISIWIIATIVWRGYMKKNKIEIWR